MDQAQAIMDLVASYQDKMIEAQRRLTAEPALGPDNGGPGEMARALMVQGWLEELGLEIQRVDAPDKRVPDGVRPNILAWLPGGDGPRVWVLSHLDVVPAGDLNLWDSDPWTMRQDGDFLYGRGVSDNQQGLVASLYALKAVQEMGLTLPGNAGLVLVSDEETASAYGLEYVLGTRPEFFSPEDLIVVPDAGEPEGDFIEVSEKSILWLRVEVTGKQVHGSMPEKGVNALFAAARMMASVRRVGGGFPRTDPLFSPPGSTFEPTAKEAGVTNVNTIPGRDVFYIDCRVLPGIDLGQVIAAFEQEFGKIAAEERAGVSITPVQRIQAPEGTAPDAPVVRALQGAIARVRGIQARTGGVGGGTVAAFFRQKGLAAAVWNTWHNTAHMPNEYCLVSDMIADAQVFALLMAGLAR